MRACVPEREAEGDSRERAVAACMNIWREQGAVGAHVVALQAVSVPAATGQQWVQLLPAGSFEGADGRGPYVLEDAAAVVAASMPDAGRGRHLPIDYDHAIDFAAPRGEPARAAGWIEELQPRADGIWGLVSWTPPGLDALKNREYRFISPVFEHEREGGRVIRLLRAALTNNPNFNLVAVASANPEKGMDLDKLLTELRTALGLPADADAAKVVETATATAAVAGATQDAAKGLKAIAVAAGLAETAKLDEIVAAVAETKKGASGDPDPAKYVPIAEHRALAARVDQLDRDRAAEKATAAVDEAIKAGKVTPAGRDWAVAYAQKDPDGFAAFVKAQPVIVQGGEMVGNWPVTRLGGKDAGAIALEAAAWQAEQAKSGRHVSIAEAVRHVTGSQGDQQ